MVGEGGSDLSKTGATMWRCGSQCQHCPGACPLCLWYTRPHSSCPRGQAAEGGPG